jgi:hypothetical protein
VTATVPRATPLHTISALYWDNTYHLTIKPSPGKFTVSRVETFRQPRVGLRTLPSANLAAARVLPLGLLAQVFRIKDGTTRPCHLLVGALRDFVVRSSGQYVAQSFSVMLPCSAADRSQGTARRSLIAWMSAIPAARTDNKSDAVIPWVRLIVRRRFPSRIPLANGQTSASVKTVRIDHRFGLAAHHAIDEKSAFIAAML